MAEGMVRREGTQDSLAGQAGMEPVQLRGQGIKVPQRLAVDTHGPDTAAAITQGLAQWAGTKFGEAADKKNKRDKMEGQMAHMQGQTFEQVETGGNKWAMEGYRLMDAQTMASSLLSAQQEMIAQSDYQMDPDAYREAFMGRVDQMLDGVDPATADLVREQFTRQMPTLISQHTTAHMRHKEQMNYDSLVNLVDTVSRDPTASGELVAFAQGEGSPQLSDARRTQAVTDGVIKAFQFDNPMAYAHLAANGLLGPESLSTAQHQQIEAAKKQFEQRRRNEYNQELLAETAALEERVMQGEDPTKLTEEYVSLLAKHGITASQHDAASVYNPARDAERMDQQAVMNDFEAAALRGDYVTMANITTPFIIDIESNGNPDAVSPKGAKGLMQVMDDTNSDPGYGVVAARDGSAAERVRVGKDYWRTLLGGRDAHPDLPWSAGDIDTAAMAYNWGPGNVKKWIKKGRPMTGPDAPPKETRDYVQKLRKKMENWKGLTSADRLAISQQNLQQVRQNVAAEQYEAAAYAKRDLDDRFAKGEITPDDWKLERRAIDEQYQQERTIASVNQEIAVLDGVEDALAKKAEQTADDAYAVKLDAARGEIGAMRAAFSDQMSQEGVTRQDIQEGLKRLSAARQEVMDKYGIVPVDQQNGAFQQQATEMALELFKKADTFQAEQAQINRAMAQGTVGDLPKKLQDRAFDQMANRSRANVEEARAAGVIQSDEEAQSQMAGNLNAQYAEAGSVPTMVNKGMTAAIRRGLLTKDGKPSPHAVDTLQNYMELKQMNPHAAATMLDEKERTLADLVLIEAGGNPAALEEAVASVGHRILDNSGKGRVVDFKEQEAVQTEIRRISGQIFGADNVGWWQGFFSPNAERSQYYDTLDTDYERRATPEQKNKIMEAVEHEMGSIYALHPLQSIDAIGDLAMERVQQRTALIGGEVLVMPKGVNLRKEFFGANAQEMTQEGAINSAIMHWLQTDEAVAAHPYLDDGATYWEQMPWALTEATGLGADVINGVFGTRFNPRPEITQNDAQETQLYRGGVRPFEVTPVGTDGKNIAIHVSNPAGGFYEPIVLPMRRIGEVYMAHKISEMSQ